MSQASSRLASAGDVTLLYIHGFNSSPQSFKARLLQEYFDRRQLSGRFRVPALPPEPRKAMAMLEQELAAAGPVALLGSSLGGFYATWLAAHHDVPAVLINPAVRPWRLLAAAVGQQANYHTGETWQFEAQWLDQLRHYQVETIPKPENLLVMLQTGDETLDWRDAWDYYADCHLMRTLGGSHGYDDFDAVIPLVLRFCGITAD